MTVPVPTVRGERDASVQARGGARAAARSACAGGGDAPDWRCHLIQDAKLIVSELASNSIAATPGEDVWLLLAHGAGAGCGSAYGTPTRPAAETRLQAGVGVRTWAAHRRRRRRRRWSFPGGRTRRKDHVGAAEDLDAAVNERPQGPFLPPVVPILSWVSARVRRSLALPDGCLLHRASRTRTHPLPECCPRAGAALAYRPPGPGRRICSGRGPGRV